MTQKLRILLVFLLLSTFALSGLAFQVASPFFQIDDTPTPVTEFIQPEDGEPPLDVSEAANSDGIAFLGILIFTIIIIPIWVLRKEW